MAKTMMFFPETVEEFMEQYKIVDTEQIYTNGAELVPIFRMKQWFISHPCEPQRWIPVTERLPENGYEVLVTVTYPRCTFRDIDWVEDGEFWKHKDAVSAWHPLPLPYKEGEEE